MNTPFQTRFLPRPGRQDRSGQIIIFLLLIFLSILLLALLHVDIFLAIRRKTQTQNAGDAAALAAARWQGATLNLEGELNLMHALAACEGDTNAIAGINALQARLAFSGPVAGLFAAQVAAKQNHMFVDPDMTALVKEHAQEVRNAYAGGGDDDLAYPQPWEGAWNDYAAMIEAAAQDGIAAGPGNMRYFDTLGDHMLLRREFYQAVEGRDWCWFFFNANDLLNGYQSYHDWDPLPEPADHHYDNSEIFGVNVHGIEAPLEAILSREAVSKLATDWGFAAATEQALDESGIMTNAAARWFVYEAGSWGDWTAIDPYGEEQFPVAGPVKDEYNVDGAAAVCRVTGKVIPVSPSAESKEVEWSAAAKPFGYLDDETEGHVKATAAGGLVVPAFREVRLVPLDAASGADLNTADVDWIRHVRRHLKNYLANGPSVPDGCPYCAALVTWEEESFRQFGIAWLKLHSGTCHRGGGGGAARRGGTAHGH